LLSGGTFGSTVLHAYSRSDVFITNIFKANGVNDLVVDNTNSIHIYPNPNSGTFTINSDERLKINNITIYNVIGQIVHQVDKLVIDQTSNLQVDLSTIQKGIYFIDIKAEDQKVYRNKIVIQ
jgi:hypothetical protein